MEGGIAALLRTYVPEYNGPLQFGTSRQEDKLIVNTNIDFSEANRLYHQKIPATHSSLSPAYLLAHLLSVKADLNFAARYESEIAIDEINALIIRQHIGQLSEHLAPSLKAATVFQEFVFDNSRAIAEGVRRGTCRLKDFLPVLHKAAKFKEWLSSDAPQQDILKAYFREVVTPT